MERIALGSDGASAAYCSWEAASTREGRKGGVDGCGQAVTLAIPALDVTGLAGTARSVGTQPIPSATDGRCRLTTDLVDAPKHHMNGSEA